MLAIWTGFNGLGHFVIGFKQSTIICKPTMLRVSVELNPKSIRTLVMSVMRLDRMRGTMLERTVVVELVTMLEMVLPMMTSCYRMMPSMLAVGMFVVHGPSRDQYRRRIHGHGFDLGYDHGCVRDVPVARKPIGLVSAMGTVSTVVF